MNSRKEHVVLLPSEHCSRTVLVTIVSNVNYTKLEEEACFEIPAVISSELSASVHLMFESNFGLNPKAMKFTST